MAQITIFLFFFILSVPLSSSSTTLNVTTILTNSQHLTIATNLISTLSIDAELKEESNFTLFLPTDTAFHNLSASASSQFRSLLTFQKYNMIKAHMIRDYITPTDLQSFKLMQRQTLSSESMEGYLLNITAINNTVVELETPIVHHSIVFRAVYYRQPIAIYIVSKVLLPKELFGIHKKLYDDAPPSELGPHLPMNSGSDKLSSSGLVVCLIICSLLFSI